MGIAALAAPAELTIADGGQLLEGVFEDVDAEGILLLRLADGTLQRVQVGDLVV